MKIIVGGGISGLWLAAELKARNIACCVIEKSALGQGQTLASQGMIHGGTKYALNGLLTKATDELSAMPERWLKALSGDNLVDLRGAKLERKDQLLWSVGSIQSKLLGFFASKAMRARVARVDPSNEPAFNNPKFKGHLYRLSEPVLQLDSVIQRFSTLLDGCLFQAEVTDLLFDQGHVKGIKTNRGELEGEVILTAGEGIQSLLLQAGLANPKMQRRPLAMAICKMKCPIPKVFGHQIGSGSKPELTISTHEIDNVQYIYLGGQLAETGVTQNDSLICDQASHALAKALPWLEPQIQSIRIFRINRAEPKTQHGNRPNSPFMIKSNGLTVCWPTKLALAPALSDQIIPQLANTKNTQLPVWPIATPGQYPWL